MEKKKLINFTKAEAKKQQEQEIELLQAIEEAREELQTTREYFHMVNDPKLIDYAIFREEAVKAKYIYLLNEAKQRGIKIDLKYSIKDLNIS